MFGLKAEPHAASGAAADKEKNKETKAGLIVDGIESGKQTPATTGLYGLAPEVRAEAAKRGVDLEKLQLQELAAKKQIQSLNGPQMTRFVGLAQSVDNTIDEANRLAKEMGNSGISKLNKAKLEALIGYEGNSERGKLATRYLTTINTLKEICQPCERWVRADRACMASGQRADQCQLWLGTTDFFIEGSATADPLSYQCDPRTGGCWTGF